MPAFKSAINELASAPDLRRGPEKEDPDRHVRSASTSINVAFLEHYARLVPFGVGNPKPVFLAEGIEVVSEPKTMQGRHVKFWAEAERPDLRGPGLGQSRTGPAAFGRGDRIDLAYYAPYFRVPGGGKGRPGRRRPPEVRDRRHEGERPNTPGPDGQVGRRRLAGGHPGHRRGPFLPRGGPSAVTPPAGTASPAPPAGRGRRPEGRHRARPVQRRQGKDQGQGGQVLRRARTSSTISKGTSKSWITAKTGTQETDHHGRQGRLRPGPDLLQGLGPGQGQGQGCPHRISRLRLRQEAGGRPDRPRHRLHLGPAQRQLARIPLSRSGPRRSSSSGDVRSRSGRKAGDVLAADRHRRELPLQAQGEDPVGWTAASGWPTGRAGELGRRPDVPARATTNSRSNALTLTGSAKVRFFKDAETDAAAPDRRSRPRRSG